MKLEGKELQDVLDQLDALVRNAQEVKPNDDGDVYAHAYNEGARGAAQTARRIVADALRKGEK